MRLIDADAIGIGKARREAFTVPKYADGWNEAIDIICAARTVDAVPVIRCKDCEKDGLATCPMCFIENRTLQFINHDQNFYCGYGERKENERS